MAWTVVHEHEIFMERTAIGSEMVRAVCRCGNEGVWRLNDLTARMDGQAHKAEVKLGPPGEIGAGA